MVTIDGVTLNIDEALVKRYQKLTGDSDELLLEVFKHMIKVQSGLMYDVAITRFSSEQLSRMIEDQITTELSGFWEV